MMGILDTNFKVGSYLKPLNEFVDERKNYEFGAVRYTDEDVRDAREWAEMNNRVIITPCDSLSELEALWTAWCSQTKKARRESDWKSEEYFGLINQYHYEILKDRFLSLDVDYPSSDILGEAALDNDSLETNGVSYSPVDVENAIDWAKMNDVPIIHPTRSLEDLEKLWDNYNSYHRDIRRESDWKSIECFGLNNQSHYEYLKSQFLKDDIPETKVEAAPIGDPIRSHIGFTLNESVDAATKATDLLGLLGKNNESYDDSISREIVDIATELYSGSNQNIHYDIIPNEDLPFFSPEEMIDAGVNQANPENNFYGCEPATDILAEGESYSDWLNSYSLSCNGLAPFDSIGWMNKIANLSLKMKTAQDQDPYKQALLSLGWPAEVEFSPENRIIATKRTKSLLSDKVGSTEFIDLTGFNPTNADIHESVEEGLLKPVYIVLIGGKTMFSKAIKDVTHSNYSHASISFDPELKEMYSYGIEGSKKGIIGGFIKEDIKDAEGFQPLEVYSIFLKKEDWEKLRKIINDFIKNAGKTSYSYINLIVSHIFKIPMELSRKMVCSQFVDKVLKLIDVDISNKKSSLVSPADIDKYGRANKKIYTLFQGKVDQFQGNRVKKLTDWLLKKKVAEPIKEMNTIELAHFMINEMNNIDSIRESDINDPQIKKIYEAFIKPCLEAECYTEGEEYHRKSDIDIIESLIPRV